MNIDTIVARVRESIAAELRAVAIDLSFSAGEGVRTAMGKMADRLSSPSPSPAKGLNICLNCGEPGPHYVPPSLGEPGFFHCEKKKTSPAKAEAADEDGQPCPACVDRGGRWGPGAIDDPLSSAAGGKPWYTCGECMGTGKAPPGAKDEPDAAKVAERIVTALSAGLGITRDSIGRQYGVLSANASAIVAEHLRSFSAAHAGQPRRWPEGYNDWHAQNPGHSDYVLVSDSLRYGHAWVCGNIRDMKNGEWWLPMPPAPPAPAPGGPRPC